MFVESRHSGDVSAYAEIIKYEKQDDGTAVVYGKATDDTLDIDRQIADPSWLAKAMPEWFKSGGNIREMHGPSAAGVATDYEEKADGHYVKALVVDPTAVKKVEHGVYKGFSIGIRGPRIQHDMKAANGRIVDGQIVEVSLVDRPANPSAKFVMAKSVDGELLKVEETVEEPVDAVVGEKAATPGLLTFAKSVRAELNKFDQASFDAARTALASLVAAEAQEMAEGEDERKDIEELLDAIKHLFRWYEGEVADGEVPGQEPSQSLGDMIGDMIDDANDKTVVPDTMIAVTITDEQIAEIVGKAVQQATEAVRAEVEGLKAAKVAAESETEQVRGELGQALTKAAAGGPKRAGIVQENARSEWLTKAAHFERMASTTTDSTLAEGYRELAEDALAKANTPTLTKGTQE